MKINRLLSIPVYTNKLSVSIPKRKVADARPVFGFDTEYDSRTQELLSIQLWRPDRQVFFQPKNGKISYAELKAFTAPYRNPFLVAFFALADISKLSDYWVAHLSETGLGCLMAEYKDMTIFDISTFWSSDKSFSLSKLGKLIGVEKLAWDRGNVSRSSLTENGFRAYAMRDAEICYKAYHWLSTAIDNAYSLPLTSFRSAPYLSTYIFRNRLQKPLDAPLPAVRRFALRCYWGGRSEIFARGRIVSPIIEADANSLYPRSAMSFESFPDGSSWEKIRTQKDLTKTIDGFLCVAFKYPNSYEGFFGLPVDTDKGLTWPSAGVSYCTLSELRASVEACPDLFYCVRFGFGYAHADRSELPSYLSDLIAKKDASTGAARYVYKLLANSIIGKLAQNKKITTDSEHITRAGIAQLPADYLPRNREGKVQVGSCFWPEAASLILGKARSVLLKAMNRVGRENLLVCSTDSVIAKNSSGYAVDDTYCAFDGVPFQVQHVTSEAVIWREKVYALQNGEKLIKTAHHALPKHAMEREGRLTIETDARSLTVETKQFVKISGASRGSKLGDVIPLTKSVTLEKQR